MQASSLTSRLNRRFLVREWTWWQLPPVLRCYVAALPVGTLALIGIAASLTNWRVSDVVTFVILLLCGMVSVALTPRIMYTTGGATRDFSTVWVIPIAILLPPVYAAIAPIPILATLYFCVHRGVPHRTVFTAASISIPYAAVSAIFRWFPHSIAGAHPGTGWHALTWALSVAVCEIIAGRAQHFFIVGAVKLSDSTVRLRDMDLSVQALEGDFLKVDLGVLITLAVALTPAMVIVAVPTVFLVRRFLEHPILMAQSRVDSKTSLLNVSTWEKEAEAELSRAVRTRNPIALLLVDIDHFKTVNDTYGHLVGDKVLKAVAAGLTTQSRDYDRAGRFGGEEFVLLLAQTTETDACKIAERLRAHVEALAVRVDERADSPLVNVTISIGVTAIARGEKHELTDLLAAADSALYHAKQAGRNRVAVATPQRNMGLDTFNAHLAGPHHQHDDALPVTDPRPASAAQSPRVVQVHVRANPTPLSLCQNWSLCVPIKPQHESDSLK